MWGERVWQRVSEDRACVWGGWDAGGKGRLVGRDWQVKETRRGS